MRASSGSPEALPVPQSSPSPKSLALPRVSRCSGECGGSVFWRQGHAARSRNLAGLPLLSEVMERAHPTLPGWDEQVEKHKCTMRGLWEFPL